MTSEPEFSVAKLSWEFQRGSRKTDGNTTRHLQPGEVLTIRFDHVGNLNCEVVMARPQPLHEVQLDHSQSTPADDNTSSINGEQETTTNPVVKKRGRPKKHPDAVADFHRVISPSTSGVSTTRSTATAADAAGGSSSTRGKTLLEQLTSSSVKLGKVAKGIAKKPKIDPVAGPKTRNGMSSPKKTLSQEIEELEYCSSQSSMEYSPYTCSPPHSVEMKSPHSHYEGN